MLGPIARAFAGLAAALLLLTCTPDATHPSNASNAAGARSFEAEQGAWRLTYSVEPDPIPLNALFALEVKLVDRASADAAAHPDDGDDGDDGDGGNGGNDGNDALRLVAVSADMPDHGHGMTLEPKLVPLGGGRYRVEGMLFHMPGRWQLSFDVARGAKREGARFDVILE